MNPLISHFRGRKVPPSVTLDIEDGMGNQEVVHLFQKQHSATSVIVIEGPRHRGGQSISSRFRLWMNPLISHFREIKILVPVDAKCGRDKRGGAFKETSESVAVTPVKTANCEQKEKNVLVVAEKVVSIETLALCAGSVLDEGRSREDMRTVEISTQNDQPFEFQIPFSAEDVGERRLVIWKKGAAPLGHDLKSLCHLGHKAPIEKDFLRDVLSIPDCIKPPLQIVQVYNAFVQRGYEAEWKRLASFKDCPEQNWYPAIPLAEQGFHFKPHSSVVCYFCKGELHTWERDWDPKQKHEPNCPLPNGRDCGNIPMKPSRDNGKYQPAVQAVYNELQIQELQDKNQVLLRNSKRSLESFKNPQLPEYQMEYLSINVNQGQGQQGHDAMEDEPQPSTSSQQQQEGAGGLRYFVHSYDEHGRPISTSQKMEFNSQEEKANTSMKRETDRLKTFDNVWKKGDVILPKELAKSGFYYAGTGDRARCAFCNGVLRNWAVGDRAPAEHRRHYPTCPFVLNLDVGNIPSSPDLSGLHTSTAATTNHTELNRPAARTPGQQSARSSVANVGATTTPSAVPGTILVPKHSNFRTVETRLLTYDNWPTSNVQRPKELAEAGFFYTGTSDNVRCFHCDGGLRNWLDSDLPWVEHAKWFPRCGYLQRVKGVEFVLEEMRKHNQQNFTTAVAENRGSTGLMTTPTPTPGVGIVERPSTSGVRRVEAREVRARYDTDRVKMVLDMGYKEAVVKYVILQRLRYTGDDFPNTQEMLESVLAEEPNLEEKGIAYYENILQTEFGRPMTIVYPQITQTPSQAPPMTQSTSAYLPIPGDEKTLVEENRQLKEQTMCKICMDNEVSMVFIPCGHLVACADCAPSLSQCPICRRAITGTIRTFLS
ncbi:baculoviral IAP repeat-containing protein 3-like isoform X2 [Lineus longissimus]